MSGDSTIVEVTAVEPVIKIGASEVGALFGAPPELVYCTRSCGRHWLLVRAQEQLAQPSAPPFPNRSAGLQAMPLMNSAAFGSHLHNHPSQVYGSCPVLSRGSANHNESFISRALLVCQGAMHIVAGRRFTRRRRGNPIHRSVCSLQALHQNCTDSPLMANGSLE